MNRIVVQLYSWHFNMLMYLTLILLTWTIWRAATNASKWRMGFNSAFKVLIVAWRFQNLLSSETVYIAELLHGLLSISRNIRKNNSIRLRLFLF